MIILVAGLPGSGKSYFAFKLSQKINAHYLSSDQFRKIHTSVVQYTEEDKLSIYRKLVEETEKFLIKRDKVIIDATFFKERVRNMFYKMAQKHESKICIILIYAQEEIIEARIKEKREHSDANFEVYKKIKSEFEAIKQPHLTLHSTNYNIRSMLSHAVHYLDYFNAGK